MTRVWLDTEFIEDGRTIELLSIGMVREDGAELYLENADADLSRAGDWVRENVFPHLQMAQTATLNQVCFPKADIARKVAEFVGENPEIWGYYADYDWVAFCQLYGTMMDLPKGWPMYCLDIKQLCVSLGDPRLPEQGVAEHNALADARWNRTAWEFLMSRRKAELKVQSVDWSHLCETVAGDAGKVRLGGYAPTLPAADRTKVRR